MEMPVLLRGVSYRDWRPGCNISMTVQEIHRPRERKPFRPFHVLTADGRHYDVLHPECLGQSSSGRPIMIGLQDEPSSRQCRTSHMAVF